MQVLLTFMRRGQSAAPGGACEATLCWWASLETIASNSYNLAAGHYKPQVAERPPKEDPAELIREVLAIERETPVGLEKLLQEIEV
jgi:type I restriction enzyme M protein